MSAGARESAREAAGRAPIRLLILSNHRMIRAGLRKVIEEAESAWVVDECDAGDGVAETAARFRPDVVLLDADACDAEQLESLPQAIQSDHPARLLAVAADSTPEAQQGLVRIGAMGCVTKEQPAEVLVKAIEKVHRGEVWFDRSTLAHVVADIRDADRDATAGPDEARIASLTSREVEIIEGIAEGLKNRQIARRLFISEVTVRHHLTSIYSKLALPNRQRLMLYAFERGLAAPPGRPAG